MTLDVENCHSTVHIKQANMSMMEYSRSFGLTMKESIKRVTQWAAYYHTSRKSWYPKPEETIPFSKVPTMQPLPIVKMSQANCDVLRNWASSYGAAVRQRTVRQETTMAKHGTLPEFMYQRKCVTLDTPVTIESGECRVEVAEQDAEDDLAEPVESADQESQDEFMDEFDTSSDEEESTDAVSDVSGLRSEAIFVLVVNTVFLVIDFFFLRERLVTGGDPSIQDIENIHREDSDRKSQKDPGEIFVVVFSIRNRKNTFLMTIQTFRPRLQRYSGDSPGVCVGWFVRNHLSCNDGKLTSITGVITSESKL
ncbi:Hypothetical predicted protein, partial [Paramuricea clavata]